MASDGASWTLLKSKCTPRFASGKEREDIEGCGELTSEFLSTTMKQTAMAWAATQAAERIEDLLGYLSGRARKAEEEEEIKKRFSFYSRVIFEFFLKHSLNHFVFWSNHTSQQKQYAEVWVLKHVATL